MSEKEPLMLASMDKRFPHVVILDEELTLTRPVGRTL
jgi:hypothetical protein